MNRKDHKQECACGVCDQVRAGVSFEVAMANFKAWENENLEKYGWYVHYVGAGARSLLQIAF